MIFPLGWLFLCICRIAPGTVLDPRLEARLRAPGAGGQSVLVTLAAPLKVEPFPETNKKRRRAEYARRLRAGAERNRAPLAAWLHGKGIAFRPLWIANAVALSAPPAVVRALAVFPGVASVRPDGVLRAPAPSPAMAPAAAIGGVEWNVAAIEAPELWAMGLNGAGVVVATLDTGVDYSHVDLAGRWRGGANSWFDPHGQHALPYDAHPIGHGTGVMGLILAGAPGGSSIGVAPGARWICAKIFDDNDNASASAIHAGFQWVLDPDGNPATPDAPDVVNNSWGLTDWINVVVTEFIPDVQALQAAGIAVVGAAGNSGPAASTSLSPANYPGVLSVGGLRDAGGAYAINSGSSRGPLPGGGLYPLLTAPGESVLTTDKTFGGIFITATAVRTGTSFAAPHATGALALLMEAFPAATADQLQQALIAGAHDLGDPGPDNTYGNGMIDVHAAYNLLRVVFPNAADPAWLKLR